MTGTTWNNSTEASENCLNIKLMLSSEQRPQHCMDGEVEYEETRPLIPQTEKLRLFYSMLKFNPGTLGPQHLPRTSQNSHSFPWQSDFSDSHGPGSWTSHIAWKYKFTANRPLTSNQTKILVSKSPIRSETMGKNLQTVAIFLSLPPLFYDSNHPGTVVQILSKTEVTLAPWPKNLSESS